MPAPIMVPAPVPSSMRVALWVSIGAALLSTTVALAVVLRPGEAPAAADLDPASGSMRAVDPTEPEDPVDAAIRVASPATDALPSPSPTSPPEAPSPPSIAWPDLAVEGLPPVNAAPKSMGQSIGSPRDGALLRGARLPASRDYIIRNPDTAWGTDNTLRHLRTAIASARRKHPQQHRLVVGDISTRRGGPLEGHTSHQAGRDVDLGLFYRGHGDEGPRAFIEATREILDRRATFDLLAALAATRDEPGGVELIVLDYNLQRILRRAAEARGVAEDLLEALFQFPHGPHSRHGLIRHKPAHRDHLHVRFGCPPQDAYCRDPLLGFGGIEASDPPGT